MSILIVTFEDMCKVFGIPKLTKESTFLRYSLNLRAQLPKLLRFSIITDYDKGIKYPIADFEITPDVAIVDPDLAETMPVEASCSYRYGRYDACY